jgi:hypothetical protein
VSIDVPDGYITPPEISRFLRVHYETVRLWMTNGSLDTIRHGRFHVVSIVSAVRVARERDAPQSVIDEMLGASRSNRAPHLGDGNRARATPPKTTYKPTEWIAASAKNAGKRCIRCSGALVRGQCIACGWDPSPD